jgi:hypothetical protein
MHNEKNSWFDYEEYFTTTDKKWLVYYYGKEWREKKNI